ncbi:4-diphosphocytidyl-2C-methyl-D-erythritol synthase [Penicillium paradoxum]|uniref:4-diphosphocytidyl-2C-methyl-D-erythritol synthase n=1 Tax=Penicillium paradoxum TaxID=176176 RepID=UPI002547CD81|nr:4-diphosphocytidyl-2C-methyl-D-erythritol synthase [Penicillium paradoxum]KAJ5780719.1 4-diphosphocytidyl-2C-methyl-D-erythritol synthase [Penicillium paradoxum]
MHTLWSVSFPKPALCTRQLSSFLPITTTIRSDREEIPTIGVLILIPFADRAQREGRSCPLAYRQVRGDTVINHVLRMFRSWNATCPIVLIHHSHDTSLLKASIDYDPNTHTVDGGVPQTGVLQGLRHLSSLSKPPEQVFIHEAMRPLNLHQFLDSILGYLIENPSSAGIPVMTHPKEETVPQSDINDPTMATEPDIVYHAQTPRVYRLGVIHNVHERAATIGLSHEDDLSLYEKEQLPIRYILGDPRNIDLRHSGDLQNEEQLLKPHVSVHTPVSGVRIGHAYEIHTLAPGDAFTLCGVGILHRSNLFGRPEMDIGLCALAKALLDTISADNMDRTLTLTNPRWTNAAPDKLLRHVLTLILQAGGAVKECDVSLVCEVSRVNVHREAMINFISGIVGLESCQVSVKAQTNEQNELRGREMVMIAFATT